MSENPIGKGAGVRVMGEISLKQAFFMRLPHVLPSVRLFNRPIGLLEVRGQPVRVGIKGQADAYGWESPSGRHIEIEFKSKTGTLRDEQAAWRDFCRATGAVWMQAKAARGEAPAQTVERWVEELRCALGK